MKSILLFSLLLNMIFSIFWKNINKHLKIIDHNSTQDIHHGNICRFGGLIILFCLSTFIYIFNISSYNSLIFLFPIFFLAFLEDFRMTTSPVLRFSVSIVFCYIFFHIHPYPELSIFSFLDNKYLLYIAPLFFSLCLTTLINSFNLIDGINGILGFVSLMIITVLYHLDIYGLYHNILILSFCLVVSFLIFNFPFGKIFFGDTGAYLVGVILGITVIKIFNNYNYNEWLVLLIFIYPFFELLFSIIRRLLNRKSIFYPDSLHLHSQIFLFYKHNYNNLVCSVLSIFTLLPLIVYPLLVVKIKNDFFMLFISIITFVLVYMFYYQYFVRKNERINKN